MKAHKAILIIFVIALIPRLFVALTSEKALTHDDAGYETSAMSILKDGIYGFQKKPVAFKPPFYSFFLSLVYRIFGHSYTAVRVVQAALGSLTCLVIYFIGLYLVSANAAFISGLLAAVNISFIFSTQYLMPEAVVVFLLSLTVLVLAKIRQAPSCGRRVLAGLLAGILTLTRSEMVFFLPFVYLTGLFLVCLKSYPWRLFLKDAAVVFAAFFLVVGLWAYRNWRVYHAFVPVTTSVGINLYSSYCPPQGKLFGWTAYDETVKSSLKISDEVARSKFLAKETFRYIRDNPDKLPRLELLKLAFFWSPFDWETIAGGAYNYSFGFILPFFIWGFLAGIKKWKQYYLLYGPVLFFQLTTLVFYGSPRFRIPCEPFILVFAAIGVLSFFDKIKRKTLAGAYLAAFLLFNITLYFYSGALRGCLKQFFIISGLW